MRMHARSCATCFSSAPPAPPPDGQAYCGSCWNWSFSTAADLEGTTFLRTGALTPLSNQQLVSCSTNNNGCDGGLQLVAMQYTQHFGGLVPWSALPYANLCMDDACGGGFNASTGTPTCDTALLNAELEARNASALTGWQIVAMGAEYEDLMRVAMLKNGPIAILLNSVGMDF